MFQPLDGPAAQIKLTAIGTATPVEAMVGATALPERAAVTLQPNGNMKVYFSDGSVPSAATVLANGLDHAKSAKETYEAGEQQRIFLLAVTGTIDVILVERA
jgi:hypothetical protein